MIYMKFNPNFIGMKKNDINAPYSLDPDKNQCFVCDLILRSTLYAKVK